MKKYRQQNKKDFIRENPFESALPKKYQRNIDSKTKQILLERIHLNRL